MGKNVTVWSPVIGELVLNSTLLNEILGDQSSAISQVAITTAGAGTLTAAGLVAGQIARTGPSGAFTDTTDTAAHLATALGGWQAGLTFVTRIKNATAFVQTLAAGTGVTLPVSILVPPFSIGNFFGTLGGTAASPTATLTHINTSAINLAAERSSPQASALVTVGAGTILAASINAGVVTRGGTQIAAFTDTTDTVANLLAGISALSTTDGSSAEFTYVNNGVFPATLAGASNVTITGQTVIPANSWARYLITRTDSTHVAITCVGQGYFPHSGTFVCNGVTPVTVADANLTANSVVVITLKTVGGTVGAVPHVATVTPQTGFTTVGTASDTSTYAYTILG